MFPQTVFEIDKGVTVAELGEALRNLTAAVREVGKSGTLTLTIKVAPASKGATDVVTVQSQVKTKLPEPDRRVAIFYVTDDNRLVRNDPKQEMLPLRVVDIEQQPKQLKEVV
ncbi:MAG TPA: hypothetical protein VFA33_05020 [Bryobacteraceae bacterium]|nr:hypothetical protein [Bryobacteraceae bacterium]